MNDTDTKLQTALHVASEAGHASVITALLSQGIDFTACDIDGMEHSFLRFVHNIREEYLM